MSLAEATRAAVRRHPFLLAALEADVVNYTAAARWLGDEVGGDVDSVSTALRRFAASLPDHETESRGVRVTMQSGLGETDDPTDSLLAVGGAALAPESGSLTGILADGDVDAAALAHVLRRLESAGVEALAAGVADESLLVVVERREGANAVRIVEDALAAVPSREGEP